MRIRHRHPWDMTAAEAIALQQRLRNEVIADDRFTRIDTVGGVDVGFEKRGAVTRAAVAVLSLPGLELQEYAVAHRPTEFPYIPGLLSFREVPAVLDADGATTVFRIFQEILTNVTRHAQATQIEVSVEAAPPFKLPVNTTPSAMVKKSLPPPPLRS